MAQTNKQKLGDDSLVRRLRQHESGALDELLQLYSARLRRIARRILRNREDADDVVHQSLWKAYQSMEQYRHTAKLYTWLVSITRNESLALIRKRKVQLFSLDDEHIRAAADFIHAGRGLQQTPEQIVVRKEVVSLFQQCLERLLPGTRPIVMMRLMEDRSNAEIASELKISLNAVKIRYHRGCKQVGQLVRMKMEHPHPHLDPPSRAEPPFTRYLDAPRQ